MKLLARFPLPWLHAAGIVAGRLLYWCTPTFVARLQDNLYNSGICSSEQEYRAILNESVRQMGKAATEWSKVWFTPHSEVDRLAVECRGWEVAVEALRSGRGVIFLAPHIGSFTFTLRYLAQHLPLTALYRPARQRWRERSMMEGSSYSRLAMAGTDLKGVQKLLRALKCGEAIVLPPDQAPHGQGGVWADFFGRPAYTMTLARKLQRATGAALIAVFAERLPGGRGFRLELEPVASENFDEAKLNRVVEDMVRRCPAQYLWVYNRYKIPRAANRKKFVAEQPARQDGQEMSAGG